MFRLLGAMLLSFTIAISVGRAQTQDEAALRAEAYEAAQWAVTTDAATALAKVAARFARGGGALGQLESRREQLVASRDSAEKAFVAALSGEGEAARGPIEARVAALDRQIEAIEADIGKLDPGYFDLTRPSALSAKETQALLNPNEALLLMLVNEDATYLFAVTRERFEWARSERMNEAALADMVQRVRQTAQDDVLFTPTNFDRATAFALYEGLIKPVQTAFADKKVLLTVGTGPLDSLPLAMLVTGAPQGENSNAAALQKTPWLIDRYALATLPAVSSLRALRCLLVAASQRHSGCQGAGSGIAAPATGRRVLFAAVGAPDLVGKRPIPARGVARTAPPPPENAYRGELADTEFLRGLTYLGGSLRELQTLQNQFRPEQTWVQTGSAAREAAIKSSAELAEARYIVFSTHGLLAGSSSVPGEPGLVFTPPTMDARSAEDDGLLTASEAAQLRLSADFVVLSACNTAGADGRPGAEGLSGLARAFLFAGARSLLVSHWEVSDDATPPLMAEVFRQTESGNVVDRAIALQSAIRKVRENPAWASPGFWAPFSLIGAGS
jgi:CHAT domain-containing protein